MFNLFKSSEKNAKEWKYPDLQTPITTADFESLAHDVLLQREKNINSNSNEWSLVKKYENPDILIEQQAVPNSNVTMIRVTSYVNLTHTKTFDSILQRIYDPTFEQRKELVDSIVAYEKYKTITNTINIAKTEAKCPPITNRVFVALRTYKQTSTGGYLIGIQSINDESQYFDDNYIRGVSNCGISLEPISADQIKIVSVDHIDPKGWVPTMLTNSFKETAGDWIKKL